MRDPAEPSKSADVSTVCADLRKVASRLGSYSEVSYGAKAARPALVRLLHHPTTRRTPGLLGNWFNEARAAGDERWADMLDRTIRVVAQLYTLSSQGGQAPMAAKQLTPGVAVELRDLADELETRYALDQQAPIAAAKPKRRGRKADVATERREAKLAAEWERARDNGVYKSDFAKEKGMKLAKLDTLLDRVRARRRRSDTGDN